MKLNDEKTVLLIMGTSTLFEKVNFDDINIETINVKSNDKAKNLGVIFNNEIKLKHHVNNICRTGFYNIIFFTAIRNHIDLKTATVAAHAFVTFMLDYSNLLLSGLPKKEINKIQLVQNAVTRVNMTTLQKQESLYTGFPLKPE